MQVSLVVKKGRFVGVQVGDIIVNYLQDVVDQLYKILPQYSTGKDNLLSYCKDAAAKYAYCMLLCGTEHPDGKHGILSNWDTPANDNTLERAIETLQTIIDKGVGEYMYHWKKTVDDKAYRVLALEFDERTQKAIIQKY